MGQLHCVGITVQIAEKFLSHGMMRGEVQYDSEVRFLPVELGMGLTDVEGTGENVEVTRAERKYSMNKNC